MVHPLMVDIFPHGAKRSGVYIIIITTTTAKLITITTNKEYQILKVIIAGAANYNNTNSIKEIKGTNIQDTKARRRIRRQPPSPP